MKKIIISMVCALACLSAFAQFSVGVRDNRYVYADYTFKKHYELKLEQSVYSEKIGFQYLRAYAGYKNSFGGLDYKASAYFGAAYNGSYHSAGIMASARYHFLKRLMIDATLNPHYDSGYDYKTCFSAGAGVSITQQIDFLAAYSTIPEFRMSEKRVLVGFDFHVDRLTVIPRLSIAADGEAKTIRALMGFNYRF